MSGGRDELDMVALDEAVLCVNCDRISASKGTCVGCGSAALMNLSRILSLGSKPKESRLEQQRVRLRWRAGQVRAGG
jgi:hypothetical protein